MPKLTDVITGIGKPVAYYPNIARWLGDVSTAVLVCQFMYWRGRVGDREIYKSRAEIERETAISSQAQKRICRQLVNAGLLTIVKKSMPARNYYQFNWDEIDKQFAEWCERNVPSSAYESYPQESTKRTDKSVRNTPTTSETTSETTTEKTDNAPAKPSPHQKIIDEYYKLHKDNTGDAPTINGKQAKAVKRMLQSHDERNILAKLKHYYSIDEWYTKGGRDINMFESHYDKIPLPEGAARKKPREVCDTCGRPRVGTEGSCMYCIDGQFVEAS